MRLVGVPAGAKVTIDGRPYASVRDEEYMPAGPHKIVVEAPKMLPFEAQVDLAVGEVKAVEVVLKPRPVEPRGTVVVNCEPWCEITVDGRATGKSSPAKLSLTVGTHTLTLTNPPIGVAKKITVTVEENQTVTKVVKLDE